MLYTTKHTWHTRDMATPTKKNTVKTKQATAMLAVSEQSQQAVRTRQLLELHTILLLWGVVWLLQFGVLWFAKTTDIIDYVSALCLASATTIAGVLATVIVSRKQNEAINGNGHADNTHLLWGWLAAIVSVYMCVTALHVAGVHTETIYLFMLPLLVCVIIGLVLLLSGLLLRSTPTVIAGSWLLLLGAIVIFMDVPTNLGFLAFVGGGAMIAAASVQRYLLKRNTRS